MKTENKFSLKSRASSFTYAFNGLKVLFREEHNSWIHLTVAVITFGTAYMLHISKAEWISIIIVTGFVITTELLNTAIENISDFVSPAKHEAIKKIKDLSAAAVLVSALTALLTGIIIFLPKLL